LTVRKKHDIIVLAQHKPSGVDRMRYELRRARKEAKLTQKQLAELVGIERSTYAHIESGRPPSFKVALAIAAALGGRVEDLFSPLVCSAPTKNNRQRIDGD